MKVQRFILAEVVWDVRNIHGDLSGENMILSMYVVGLPSAQDRGCWTR